MFKKMQAPAQELMRRNFDSRTVDLSGDTCAIVDAQRKMESWRKIGRYTVFSAGAFDLLGINHIRGLVQCRMLGAMSLMALEEVETEHDYRQVHEVAASQQIGLIISMDTNQALEEGKSRRPEKGNAPKPTLDWSTRAAMLASQSMAAPGYDGGVNLIDYITRHGPGCCNVCTPGTCINEDDSRIAVALQPDAIVVNVGSHQTITDLGEYKRSGKLPKTELIAIDENEGAFSDDILGGIVSTTAIINRIRS